MSFLVINLDEQEVAYEGETKGLCNQWLLENFVEKKHDPRSPLHNHFNCPFRVLIANSDRLKVMADQG